ncbi:hypothetical protein [Thalassobaculum litoreum]|uniref:Uncharacterized protein n=1 Tax=Thalassobaculum litoreum DSM 18839 TaxID=1123362 RepID=A0A8G2BEG7_9PROT|nr:hypothetical protein [Thalassobaculum litoreum]SDF15857.1 hypothetical protein SAMN05660686_00501 [Thalassobaculum litoreum DSM 18839]
MTGTAGETVAPIIWSLVQIAGDHMNQSDELDRPDEGGALADLVFEAFGAATPTDPREVGALLLTLRSKVDDLESLAYERAPRPGVSDEYSGRVARIADAVRYSLVRAVAVLWQEEWTGSTERLFAHHTTMGDRRKISADLHAMGLPVLPAMDGEGGEA